MNFAFLRKSHPFTSIFWACDFLCFPLFSEANTTLTGREEHQNQDTTYKIELGKKWEQVTPPNYSFRLVSKDKIEEFITELQTL